MPSWSVPPGLMVPGPRQPDADDQPSEPSVRPSEPGPQPSAVKTPIDRSSSWPGVAPPAGWFLHAARSFPADSGQPADNAPAEPQLLADNSPAEPEPPAEPERSAPA